MRSARENGAEHVVLRSAKQFRLSSPIHNDPAIKEQIPSSSAILHWLLEVARYFENDLLLHCMPATNPGNISLQALSSSPETFTVLQKVQNNISLERVCFAMELDGNSDQKYHSLSDGLHEVRSFDRVSVALDEGHSPPAEITLVLES